VQLDLVSQLEELEEHRQRGSSAGAGCRTGLAQHLAEVGVRISRLHLPQRTAEPVPDQRQVVGVVADRTVGQPGRGPSQHKPSQQIGLVVSELLLCRRRPQLTQIPDRRQHQLTPPNFTLIENSLAGVSNEVSR
jgi:hypothetical protein